MTERAPDGVISIPGRGLFQIVKHGTAKNSPVDVCPIAEPPPKKPDPVIEDVPAADQPKKITKESLITGAMDLDADELDRRKKVAELLKLCNVNERGEEAIREELLSEFISKVRNILIRFRSKLATIRLTADQLADMEKLIDAAIEEVFSEFPS